MDQQGKSIKSAIRYLDAFYRDVGLMYRSIDNLLSEKGFMVFPKIKNTASFYYDLTNHIGLSNRWTMKNIQRLYILEANERKKGIERAIVVALSLNPVSLFDVPVLISGVIKYKEMLTVSAIWDIWLWEEYYALDTQKNNWRIINPTSARPNDSVHVLRLVNHKYADKIESFSSFIIDVMKIENISILNERVIEPLVDISAGENAPIIDNPLIIRPIPNRLYESWIQADYGSEGDKK